jgi:hypothetical protein
MADQRTIVAKLQLLLESDKATRDLAKVDQQAQAVDKSFASLDGSGIERAAQNTRQLAGELSGVQGELNQSRRSVVDFFSEFESGRDKVTRAVAVFGDLGTSTRTLTGAAVEFDIISPETERSLNRVAETFDSVEAGARLAADSLALFQKAQAAGGAAGAAAAGAIGAATLAFVAMSVAAEENNKQARQYVDAMKRIEVEVLEPQQVIADATASSLAQARDEQQGYIKQLEDQNTILRNLTDDGSDFEQTLDDISGAIGDSQIEIYNERIAENNEQIALARRNYELLNSAQVVSAARQREQIGELDRQGAVNREVALAIRDANTAQVESTLERIEIEKQLEQERLDTLQALRQEELARLEENTRTERVDNFLESYGSLSDVFSEADRAYLGASESAEDFRQRLLEVFNRIAESAGLTEEELGGLSAITLANSRRIKEGRADLVDSIIELEVETEAYNDEIRESKAELAVLDARQNAWNTTVREAAQNNEQLTESIERVRESTSELTAAQESYDQATQALNDAVEQRAKSERRHLEDEERAAEQAARISEIKGEIRRLQQIENERKFQERLAGIEEEGQEKLLDIRRETQDKEQDIRAKAREESLKAQREYSRRLRDIERDQLRGSEQAALENDVVAFLREQTSAANARQDATTDFLDDQSDRRQAVNQELEENRRLYQERLAEQRAATEEEIAQTIATNERELSEEAKQIERLEGQRRRLEEQFAQDEQRIRLQRERQDFNERLRELNAAKIREKNLLVQAYSNQLQVTGQWLTALVNQTSQAFSQLPGFGNSGAGRFNFNSSSGSTRSIPRTDSRGFYQPNTGASRGSGASSTVNTFSANFAGANFGAPTAEDLQNITDAVANGFSQIAGSLGG